MSLCIARRDYAFEVAALKGVVAEGPVADVCVTAGGS